MSTRSNTQSTTCGSPVTSSAVIGDLNECPPSFYGRDCRGLFLYDVHISKTIAGCFAMLRQLHSMFCDTGVCHRTRRACNAVNVGLLQRSTRRTSYQPARPTAGCPSCSGASNLRRLLTRLHDTSATTRLAFSHITRVMHHDVVYRCFHGLRPAYLRPNSITLSCLLAGPRPAREPASELDSVIEFGKFHYTI